MTLTGLSFWQYAKKSNVKKLSLTKKNSCAFLCSSFLFANYLKAISLSTYEKKTLKNKIFFLIPSINYCISEKDELNFVNKILNKQDIEVDDYKVFYRSKNEELIFGAFMSDHFAFLNFVNNFDLNNQVCQKAALKKFIISDRISQNTYKDFFDHSIFLINSCKNKKEASKRFLILIYSAIFYVKKNNKFDFFKFKNSLESEPSNLSECCEIIFRELGEDLFRYEFFKDFAVYFFSHYDESKKENFYDKFFLSLMKNLNKEDIYYIWNENPSRFKQIVANLSGEDEAKINKCIEEIEQEKEKFLKLVREKLRTICKEKDFEALCNFFSFQNAMKNLESHMMCPLENCNRNNQGCAYLRVKNKIDTKKTETEGKFKTIVSFIDELVLSLDQFICSEIQLMNGKNIFGVVEDKIVLQLN